MAAIVEKVHRTSDTILLLMWTLVDNNAIYRFVFLAVCFSGSWACGDGTQAILTGTVTSERAVRGGALYDNWWVTAQKTPPVEDHPLWSQRPDSATNTRTGGATTRCKECHGWDYRGVDGAYGVGNHKTGFPGITTTTMNTDEVFALLSDSSDHAYSQLGLSDSDIMDLAFFVTDGLIDISEVVNEQGDSLGDAPAGEKYFLNSCASCHGIDGLNPRPRGWTDDSMDFDKFSGRIANRNPAEFLHKLRFGQPNVFGMPPQAAILTIHEVADATAYAQTLPQETP